MKLEAASIPFGHAQLSALRYLPEGAKTGTSILYSHGFSSGKFSMDSLAAYLAMRGRMGVSFDMVGHKLGGSGGTMMRSMQAAEALSAALGWARKEAEVERIVLVGHSMGGAAALQVAAWEAAKRGSPPVAGIVCMCMGPTPARGFDNQIGKAMLAQREDYVAGAPAIDLLRGLEELVGAAEQLDGLPALFVAARQDVLVPVSAVEKLAALAGRGAEVSVIESSHLEAPDRSRGAIAQWLDRNGW